MSQHLGPPFGASPPPPQRRKRASLPLPFRRLIHHHHHHNNNNNNINPDYQHTPSIGPRTSSSMASPPSRPSSLYILPRTHSPAAVSLATTNGDDDGAGDDQRDYELLLDDDDDGELLDHPPPTLTTISPRQLRRANNLTALASLHAISQAMLASDVPEYISARSANSIISELRPTRIQAEALSHLNRILDELLLFVVASSRSLATDRIKTDGVLKVFNNNSLAKDAVLEAEMELRNYLLGKKAEGGKVPLGLSATSRWDGTEAFPVASAYQALRTRCQYYSTLGDREDDSVTNGDQNIMSSEGRPIATITPGVSVYVAALLEFIAEHILKNVTRVMERDNSDEASLDDLKAAVEEDESMLVIWRQMVVKKEIEGRLAEAASFNSGLRRTSRPWQVPGEDEFDKAASGSTFRHSRPTRPSTAQSAVLAAMDRSSSSASGHSHSIGHGHNYGREESRATDQDYISELHEASSGTNTPSVAWTPSPASPSFFRASQQDRPTSPPQRTRLSRKSSFDKGLSSIFGNKRRGSIKLSQEVPSSATATSTISPVLERENARSSNFPDDFEAVMSSGQTTRVSLTPNRLHTIETQTDDEEGDVKNRDKRVESLTKKARQRPGTITVANLRNEVAAENSSRTSSSGSAAPLRYALDDSSSGSGKPLPLYPAAARRSQSTRNSNPPSSYRGPDNPSIAALPPQHSEHRDDNGPLTRTSNSKAWPQGTTTSRAALEAIDSPAKSPQLVLQAESPATDPSRSSAEEPDGDRSSTSHAPPHIRPVAEVSAWSGRAAHSQSQVATDVTVRSSPDSIAGHQPQGTLSTSSHDHDRSTLDTSPLSSTRDQVGSSLRPHVAHDGRAGSIESLGSKMLPDAVGGRESTAIVNASERSLQILSVQPTSEVRYVRADSEAEIEFKREPSPVHGLSLDDGNTRPAVSAGKSSTPIRSQSTTRRFSYLEEARPEGPPSRKIPYGRRASRDGAFLSSSRRQSNDTAFKLLNSGSSSGGNVNTTSKESAMDTLPCVGPSRRQRTASLPPSSGNFATVSSTVSILVGLSQDMTACSTVAECQSLVAEALATALAVETAPVADVEPRGNRSRMYHTASLNDFKCQNGEDKRDEAAVRDTLRTLQTPLLGVAPPSVPLPPMSNVATAYSEGEDVDSTTYKETQSVAAWLLDGAASPILVGSGRKTRSLSPPSPASLAPLQLRPFASSIVPTISSLAVSRLGLGRPRASSTGTSGGASKLTATETDVEGATATDERQRVSGASGDGSDSTAIGRGRNPPMSFKRNSDTSPQQQNLSVENSGASLSMTRKTSNSSMRGTISNGSGSGSGGVRPPPSASAAAIRVLRGYSESASGGGDVEDR